MESFIIHITIFHAAVKEPKSFQKRGAKPKYQNSTNIVIIKKNRIDNVNR